MFQANLVAYMLTVLQYAQRAVMKSSRFVKLTTMAKSDADMVLEHNHNPYRRIVPVEDPSHEYTRKFLAAFREIPDMDKISETPYVQSPLSSLLALSVTA